LENRGWPLIGLFTAHEDWFFAGIEDVYV
jgi:hypothetical protein